MRGDVVAICLEAPKEYTEKERLILLQVLRISYDNVPPGDF